MHTSPLPESIFTGISTGIMAMLVAGTIFAGMAVVGLDEPRALGAESTTAEKSAAATAVAPGWPLLDPFAPLDWGLLTVRSHAALFHLRLSYTPGRMRPLPAGEFEIMASVSHANLWGQRESFLFDGEWTRTALRASVGIADNLELGAEIPFHARSGGFMDSFIMGFHDLFGVTQARRDLFPKNQLRVETTDDTGQHTVWLTDDHTGFAMSNPVIFVRYGLMVQARGRPGITLEFALKLPVGRVRDGFATPGFDALGALAVQLPLNENFQFFAVIGAVFSPGDVIFGIRLVEWQKFFLLGFEIRPASNFTIVFHYLYQDGVAKDRHFDPLWRSTNEFVAGIKWAPDGTDATLIEFGLIENAIHDANTPDVGLHLAVRLRFR